MSNNKRTFIVTVLIGAAWKDYAVKAVNADDACEAITTELDSVYPFKVDIETDEVKRDWRIHRCYPSKLGEKNV